MTQNEKKTPSEPNNTTLRQQSCSEFHKGTYHRRRRPSHNERESP